MFNKLKEAFKTDKTNKVIKIISPLSGEVMPVAKVKDPTFSQEMLGKGVAIYPNIGRVVAPFDGTVDTVFDTFHAISLISKEKVEMLIHVGMDTVKLKGQHFKALVKSGDTIKTGDVLLEFDPEAIQKSGYDITTPVVVCNPDDYVKIDTKTDQSINMGECLIELFI